MRAGAYLRGIAQPVAAGAPLLTPARRWPLRPGDERPAAVPDAQPPTAAASAPRARTDIAPPADAPPRGYPVTPSVSSRDAAPPPVPQPQSATPALPDIATTSHPARAGSVASLHAPRTDPLSLEPSRVLPAAPAPATQPHRAAALDNRSMGAERHATSTIGMPAEQAPSARPNGTMFIPWPPEPPRAAAPAPTSTPSPRAVGVAPASRLSPPAASSPNEDIATAPPATPVADSASAAKAQAAPTRAPTRSSDIAPPPAFASVAPPRPEAAAEHTLKIGTIEVRVTPPPAPPPKAAPAAARPAALSRGLSSAFGLRQG